MSCETPRIMNQNLFGFISLLSMILSSLTTGAPSAITNLSAPIFGILGIAGFAIFAIGGKQDSDGQGTNSSPYLHNSVPTQNSKSEISEV